MGCAQAVALPARTGRRALNHDAASGRGREPGVRSSRIGKFTSHLRIMLTCHLTRLVARLSASRSRFFRSVICVASPDQLQFQLSTLVRVHLCWIPNSCDVLGKILKTNRWVQGRDDLLSQRLESVNVLDGFQGWRHFVVVLGERQVRLSSTLQQEAEKPFSTVDVILILAQELDITAPPCQVLTFSPKADGGALNTTVAQEGRFMDEPTKYLGK
jgi:hypothetical protein